MGIRIKVFVGLEPIRDQSSINEKILEFRNKYIIWILNLLMNWLESGFTFKLSVMNYNDLIRTDEQKKKKMTLPDAMKRVLLASPQEGMYSVDIANEITAQELFFKKDGTFVDGKQVRSCANNNKDIFVCLPGNMIKYIVQEPKVIVKDNKYNN